MSEATIILTNMRGGCATVGNKVHTLFRLNDRPRHRLEKTKRVERPSGATLSNEYAAGMPFNGMMNGDDE